MITKNKFRPELVYPIICCTFATRDPPSLFTMLKSGVVFLYIPLFMSITFPKDYKTPEELVELLFERGLYIHEKGSACRYIRNIGYY